MTTYQIVCACAPYRKPNETTCGVLWFVLDAAGHRVDSFLSEDNARRLYPETDAVALAPHVLLKAPRQRKRVSPPREMPQQTLPF